MSEENVIDLHQGAENIDQEKLNKIIQELDEAIADSLESLKNQAAGDIDLTSVVHDVNTLLQAKQRLDSMIRYDLGVLSNNLEQLQHSFNIIGNQNVVLIELLKDKGLVSDDELQQKFQSLVDEQKSQIIT